MASPAVGPESKWSRLCLRSCGRFGRPTTPCSLDFRSAGRGSEAIASTYADKYYTDTAYKKKSDQKFAAAGYGSDAVDGEAFLRSLPSLASIERLIASAEKRLFNFIKELEARYSARAARFKATATKVIEDATKSATPASE